MALFGDGLSIRLSARTQDFERGVDSAQSELTQFGAAATGVTGPLTVLSNRADAAGDQLADIGRESTQAAAGLRLAGSSADSTSRSFSVLTLGTHGLNLSFGALAGGMTTALIPALVLLSTTLVPLTAVLGTVAAAATGIAGAFGLIIGSGALAWHQQLRAEGSSLLDVLKAEFIEVKAIVGLFGDEFIPLLKAGVENISVLVKNTLDAVGGVEVFADALRSLGRSALTVIPQMAAGLTDLAREGLPVFMDMLRWLGRNGPRIFNDMVATTQRLAPHLMGLIDAFIEAGPAINRFGTLVLTELLPALSTGLVIFGNLLDLLAGLRESWMSMPGWLRTGIFVVVAGAVGVLSGGLLGLVAAFAAVFVAWQRTKAFLAKHGVFDAIGNAVETATGIIRNLPQHIVIALSQAIGAVAAFEVKFANVFLGLFNWISRTATSTFEGLVNTVIRAVNAIVSRINQFVETSIPGGFDAIPGVGRLQSVGQVDLQAPQVQALPTDQGRFAGAAAQGLAVTVGLEVEGDGPLADFIEENVNAKVTEERRAAQRTGGKPRGA